MDDLERCEQDLGPVIEEFKRQARLGSYHYADDTCGEWGLAADCVRNCAALWNEHPELRKQFKTVVDKELWGLKGHAKYFDSVEGYKRKEK